MQKVNLKLLLTLILINTNLYAQEYDFAVETNIIRELNINTDSQWAINGGIFRLVSDGLTILTKGKHQLLIMDDKHEIQTYLINITNGSKDTVNNIIYVDNIGPKITTQWQNVITYKDQVIVGKKSILLWQSSTDKIFSQQVFVNNKIVNTKSSKLTFDQQSEEVKLVLSDSFGNSTTKFLSVESDFEGPEIDWELAPSNIPNNNEKQIAGKYANIIVNAKDVSGIKEYLLKGKLITPENNEIKVKNNSEIILTDGLGNRTSQKIKWNIDKDKPQIKIQVNKREYINTKLIKIKTNTPVIISAFDKRAGIKSAYYFSRHKKWLKLPQTFEFLGPRRYKLRIIAEDNLGNKIKTHVTLKARR